MNPVDDLRLVPYASQPREVVLRHGNAVVLFNEHSQQVELSFAEDKSEVEPNVCPTCLRPFDHTEPPGSTDSDACNPPTFITPGYFRLLQQSRAPSPSAPSLSSSQLRLISPSTPIRDTSSTGSSAQTPRKEPRSPSHKISSEAFSQGYFKTFFVEERELGRGGNGVVLLVRHVINDVDLGRFACKRIPVGDDSEWLRKVLLEVQLLQNLSHENLVKYNHVWLESVQTSKFAPAVPYAFILQQFCNNGDLQHYIFGSGDTMSKEQLKKRARRTSRSQVNEPVDVGGPRQLSFEEIFSFFRDITSGLNYLHRNGYVHRDLKPSNCLLHTTGSQIRVLVSDFGEMQGVNTVRNSTGNTGTISFCAPEVLKKDSMGLYANFTPESDVFSLGLIVHLMCFGKLPYINANTAAEENEDIDQLRAEISAWTGLDLDRRVRTDLPDQLYRFLKLLLSIKPDERPTTEEILQGIKAGTAFYEQAHTKGPTSPSVEKQDMRPWPFASSSSAEPTSATLDMRRRPSALITRHSSEQKLMTLRDRSHGRSGSNTPAVAVPLGGEAATATSPVPLHRAVSHSYATPRLLPAPQPRRRRRDHVSHLLTSTAPPAWLQACVLGVKLWSCLWACAPLAPNAWVLYPLLALGVWGAVGLGRSFSYLTSLGLLLVHLGLLGVAGRAEGLCPRVIDVIDVDPRKMYPAPPRHGGFV